MTDLHIFAALAASGWLCSGFLAWCYMRAEDDAATERAKADKARTRQHEAERDYYGARMALRLVVKAETPKANATVRRMARIAREFLERESEA